MITSGNCCARRGELLAKRTTRAAFRDENTIPMGHASSRVPCVFAGQFKINERTILHERLNYPEADGPVAINVEGLEHVVGVETGVCNSHEGWPLTNYAKTWAVI